jgi:uncharacterized repeat protein (TIGR01451 family)
MVAALEERALLSTILVTNTNDDFSLGSLRSAIVAANNTPGTVINFQIPAGGIQTINLTSPLPQLNVPVTIDATTQTGYAGTPLIQLNGAGAGANPKVDGLDIAGGNSVVKGLAINRFSGAGIQLLNVGNDTVQFNYIGTDATGKIAQGNGSDGVLVSLNSNANQILNNVISANTGNGINLNANVFGVNNPTTTGNVIQGNLIGTDVTGKAALGNKQYGIVLNDAPRTQIGGTSVTLRNVISANASGGINLGPGDLSVVQGNYIGTDITGQVAVGSGATLQAKGIIFTGGSNDTIGGTMPGAGNVISGNSGKGIDCFVIGSSNETIQGNLIGTDSTGTRALGNGNDGVYISGPSTVLIGGNVSGAGNIISNNGNIGINTQGSSVNLTIQGNYIGTDITGTRAMGNAHDGVFIWSPTNVTIGGTTVSARNLISNNGGDGIGTFAAGQSLLIQGNYIGTDVTGTAPMGNGGTGINATFPNITIGGSTAAAGNIIAYNGATSPLNKSGVIVTSSPVPILSNSIFGNAAKGIDLNSNPVAPGNKKQVAPVVTSATSTTVTEIIGTLAGPANTQYKIQFFSNFAADAAVRFNLQLVSWGNGSGVPTTGNSQIFIGTDTSGLLHIRIFDSSGNRVTDTDETQLPGTQAAAISTLKQQLPALLPPHVLTGTEKAQVLQELASILGQTPAGFVEGQTYLGQADVITNANGIATIDSTLPVVVGNGLLVDATATDTAGNTSEFSPAITAVGPTTSADLAVSISPSAFSLNAGQGMTYTVTVANLGPDDASGVVLTDVLPANVTLVSSSSTQGSQPSLSGGTLTANIGTLAAGGTARMTIAITTSGAAPPGITDTATVTGQTPDLNPANNTTTVNTAVLNSADLEVSIVPSPTSVPINQNLVYTLTVTNHGPSDAIGVTLSDVLPAAATFVSASASQGVITAQSGGTVTANLGTMISGTTVTVTIIVTPTALALPSVVDTATVSSQTVDPDPSNNKVTLTTPVLPIADLAVTVVPAPSPVQVGDNLTYVVTIANNGPYQSDGVTFTDILPSSLTYVLATSSQGTIPIQSGGTVTANLGTILPSASATVTIITTATTGAPPAVNNTAKVTSQTPDPVLTNNSVTTTTTVTPVADVAVTLVPSTNPVRVGDTLTYTATITNNGPNVASNVTLSDDLPAGMTFVSGTSTQGAAPKQTAGTGTVTAALGSLTPGSIARVTIVARATTSAAASVTDTATVSSSVADSNASNNSASVTTTVNPSADVSLSLISTPSPVQVGQDLTYTLNINNFGPSDATAVVLTDTLPAGVRYVSAASSQGTVPAQSNGKVTANLGGLAAGASATVTIVVTPTAGTSSSIVDTAIVSTQTIDPTPSNNTATTTTAITPAADLSVKIGASASPAQVGGTLTYTLTVTNGGLSSASNVSVSDVVPPGMVVTSTSSSKGTVSPPGSGSTVTASLGTLLANETETVTIGVNVTSNALPSGTNLASVTSTTADPNMGNNSDSLPTPVAPSADLSVTIVPSTQSASPATSVQVGDPLTYTLNIKNNGPNDAVGVSVSDTLPAGVTFGSATLNQTTKLVLSGNSVVASLGTLSSGATATVTIVVTPSSGVTQLVDSATISSQTFDPTSGNNQASATIGVTSLADLTVALRGNASVQVGQNIFYTIDVTNQGPNDAVGVKLSDTLDANLSFVRSTPSVTPTGNVLNFDLGTIAKGATSSVTVVAAATTAASQSVSNTAQATSTTPLKNTSDDTQSLSTSVTPVAELSLALAASDSAVVPGQALTYTATVTNNGPSTATGVVLTDNLPGTVLFVSADSDTGPTFQTGGRVTASIGTLAAGAKAQVTIRVTPLAAAFPAINDTASVTANETDPISQNNTANASTAVSPVDVLTVGSTPSIAAVVAGQVLSNVQVASFADSSPAATVASFLATIDWGDGTPATGGLIAPDNSGGFSVFGTHAYTGAALGGGSKQFVITTSIVAAGAAGIQATAPVIVNPMPVSVSGQLTNSGSNQPSFTGSALPGATVQVFAEQMPSGSMVQIAQTVAGPSGSWNATANTLSDGRYVITAMATDRLGQTASTTIQPGSQPLQIDTTGPRISNVVFDRAHSQILVTFQDNLSGLDQGALRDLLAYSFKQNKGKGKNLVTAVNTVQPGDPTAPQTVALAIKGGKQIKSGSYTLTITSGPSGIRDARGNALDGEFSGTFSSGNGSPGGTFAATIKPGAKRGQVGPGNAALAIHDVALGSLHAAKAHHRRHRPY